ncbi:MAG TPA: ABC transporter permease [Gemmatimonadaceae bacterium]|nr:ABC transporter permease [Gemmatimonadaceae bacterium]
MRRFLARRLAHGAAVIFIAASLSFFLIHLAPGDPFLSSFDDPAVDSSVVAARKRAFGLDRPVHEQYVRFLGQLAVGNLGWSIKRGRPAAEVLMAALPRTLALMGTALVLSFGVGVTMGAWQATRAGSRSDRATGTLTLIVASLPEIWFAVVLVVVFANRLGWFPAGGMTELGMPDTWLSRLHHLALPVLTLTLVGAASIARYQRAAVLEVLPRDFLRTARAKGLSERRVLWHHALRNALVPTIVLAGLSLPTLVGGAVLVERIFSWPGMGNLAAIAVESRDYAVVVGAVLVGAVMVVVGGIVTDLLHAAIDPRVRTLGDGSA